MDTLELLTQQRDGTSTRIKELREEEAGHHRAAGLDAEIEKSRENVANTADSIAEYKLALAEVHREKREIVKTASDALATRMGKLLPMGRAIFDIDDDGSVFIGWEIEEGKKVSASGLSGGQTVIFSSALAHALLDGAKNPIIIVEAAEVGPEIDGFLAHIAYENPDAQIVAATCFPLESKNGWDVKSV